MDLRDPGNGKAGEGRLSYGVLGPTVSRSSSRFMVPATVFLTPDAAFNGSAWFGRFIDQNAATFLSETHVVPETFEGEAFLGASTFNNIDLWNAPGISDPEVRHKFSLNTCNGCHGAETQTAFLHISPRLPVRPVCCPVLSGVDVFDPVSGIQRRSSELFRRRKLLEATVCP